MHVKIGAKIKALRKRDDVTQEKLGEALGLTGQAVSKWENGSGYPDIEYITPLANFFNVTIDYLFDHDTADKRRKIDAYCAQYENFGKEIRHPHQEEIDLMRQALAEFPAEEKLLLKLAISLYFKWGFYGFCEDENGQPDFEKHKSYDSWEEAVKIMEELLSSSTDDDIRSECRRFLAPIYGGIGEKEKLLAIAEKCDIIMGSKNKILSQSLWGEDGEKAKQEYLAELCCALQHELFQSGHYWGLDRETKKEAYDIIMKLSDFIFRGDYGWYNWSLKDLHLFYAMYLINTNPNETVEALSKALAYAKTFDEIIAGEGEVTYTSPLASHLTHPREKYRSSSAVRDLLQSIMTKDLQSPVKLYKPLQENTRFIALIDEMKAWVTEKG